MEPLSREFLLSRGFCCNCGCKNCPYKVKEMIKLKDILSEVDYQSKLSRSHKPDWHQLHTPEFKPFDDVEEASGQLSKNNWTPLSGKALDKFKEELSDLIAIASKNNANYADSDLKDRDGYSVSAADVDTDSQPDVVKIYQHTDSGKKVVAIGHDGSEKAKQQLYTMKDVQKGIEDQDEGLLAALKTIIKKIF